MVSEHLLGEEEGGGKIMPSHSLKVVVSWQQQCECVRSFMCHSKFGEQQGQRKYHLSLSLSFVYA